MAGESSEKGNSTISRGDDEVVEGEGVADDPNASVVPTADVVDGGAAARNVGDKTSRATPPPLRTPLAVSWVGCTSADNRPAVRLSELVSSRMMRLNMTAKVSSDSERPGPGTAVVVTAIDVVAMDGAAEVAGSTEGGGGVVVFSWSNVSVTTAPSHHGGIGTGACGDGAGGGGVADGVGVTEVVTAVVDAVAVDELEAASAVVVVVVGGRVNVNIVAAVDVSFAADVAFVVVVVASVAFVVGASVAVVVVFVGCGVVFMGSTKHAWSIAATSAER
jgi:hypothetical protein